MSYPIGITQLMKSLKYATLLNLGKISINEYRELTTFCFSDFIYSKYQVIRILSRLSRTATCVFTISHPTVSFTRSIPSIIEMNSKPASRSIQWKWRRRCWSRRRGWGRVSIGQSTSWRHCQRDFWMKTGQSLQAIKPLSLLWTKQTWNRLLKKLRMHRDEGNDFFYLKLLLIHDLYNFTLHEYCSAKFL